MSDESQIVWRLAREQKGRYVEAARREGLSLVDWLGRACEARARKASWDEEGGTAEGVAGNRDASGSVEEAG